MPTRNTPVLAEIVEFLGSTDPDALARLEEHFSHRLIIIGGDIATVARYADELRMAISREEAAAVLDHIGEKFVLNIDQVEDAIDLLYPGRFIEADGE